MSRTTIITDTTLENMRRMVERDMRRSVVDQLVEKHTAEFRLALTRELIPIIEKTAIEKITLFFQMTRMGDMEPHIHATIRAAQAGGRDDEQT